MALSTTQKITILRLLCYPLGTIDSTSMDYSNIVNRNLDRIANEAQTEVEKVLTWIDETEVQIDAAIVEQKIKRLDDIEFFSDQAGAIERQRRMYVRQISEMIGIASKCKGVSSGVVCC